MFEISLFYPAVEQRESIPQGLLAPSFLSMKKAIFFNEFDGSYIPQILKEIYIERVYQPYLEGKKDLTILDVGANIGLFSFYAYPFAKKIYAIEPSKEHMDIMKHMLAFNDIKNVVPLQFAMGMEDGKAIFYHNNNRTAYSLEAVVNDNGITEQVETKRFDTLFKEQKIDTVDFVKLDIEGSEADILGGEGFFKVKDKIKAIMVECHPWCQRNPAQIVTALSDYGFTVNRIDAEAYLYIATR